MLIPRIPLNYSMNFRDFIPNQNNLCQKGNAKSELRIAEVTANFGINNQSKVNLNENDVKRNRLKKELNQKANIAGNKG